jgi:hypothetical protein
MGGPSLIISARSRHPARHAGLAVARAAVDAGAYLLRGARHNDSAREGASITPSKPADGNFAPYRGRISPAGP